MRTLIAVIENHPEPKTSFGSDLSKKLGIPVFDMSKYILKYGSLTNDRGTSYAWLMMLNDIGINETVILDNAEANDALKLSKSFKKKIVFLPNSESNRLTYGWIGQISEKSMLKTWVSNTVCPEVIKTKAEIINNMKPDEIIFENPAGPNPHWIWKIGHLLKLQ